MGAVRRFYPGFPLAPPSVVEAGAWYSVLDSGDTPLGATWPHWDYNTRVQVRRIVSVDVDKLRSECHLGAERQVRLVVAWRSTATQLRGEGCSLSLPRAGRTSQTLDASLPSAELGGNVLLRTQLAVGGGGPGDGPLAPVYSGSILWEEETVFRVEGSAPRFPTELVDFATTRLSSGAGWVLDWDVTDLHASLLASVRLLINTGHPIVYKATTAATPDAADLLVRSAMKFDVLRVMVMAALGSTDFLLNPDGYEDGSVGRELRRLLRTHFGTEDVRALAARASGFPGDFLAELQQKSNLFT